VVLGELVHLIRGTMLTDILDLFVKQRSLTVKSFIFVALLHSWISWSAKLKFKCQQK